MKKILVLSVIFIVSVWYYVSQRVSFSVVIPVYNAEKYLSRCLDSILAQKGNFEIIAVNDGSKDKSLQILQDYAKKHSNIRIINQKNQGVSVARNTGMAVAENEYITFIDADDWLERDVFKKISKILKQDNPDIVLTGYYDVYDREWVKQVKGEKYVNEVPEESKYLNTDLNKLALFSPFYGKEAYSDLFYASGGVRARFFKRSFIEKYHIEFPEKIACNEDAVFTFRAFLNNPLISVTTEAMHNYRNRADSISKSQNIIKEAPKSFEIMSNTPEFKQANRRTQMLIRDSWLFLINLGIANLQRHHISEENGIKEARKACEIMQQKYNPEELEACRNYQMLKEFLSASGLNQAL